MNSLPNHSTQYYDDNYSDYVEGWSVDHIHYGFWYDNTVTHEESLINHTKEVIKHLDIHQGMKILDAGCGSGGSARYIIENYDVTITGIMLSPVLLEACKKLSSNIPVKDRLDFFMRDYTDTGFNNESFDRIYAIESVCQAPDKSLFIKEAHRLLKPGGKLVIADFYLLRNDLNEEDFRSYREWCDGWAILDLASINEFKTLLHNQGFDKIEYHNKTPYIRKCGKYMYEGAQKRLPENLLMHQKGLLPETRLKHILATYRQWECIERKIWGFGMYVVEKRY